MIPTLDVDDLGDAAEFYAGLGFEREWSFPEEGPATHVGLSFGAVTLMLARNPEPGRRIERQNLYFVMRDVDGFHDRLRRRADLEVPAIVEADYGMRDFAITDPWGHCLTFGEERP